MRDGDGWRAARAPLGRAAEARPVPSVAMFERTALPSGPRVISSRVPGARSVSIAAYVLAGSRLESADEAGVAHFMEHITFKGTTGYPSTRAISEAIEGVGGSFNAATDRESTVYWVRVPRREAPRAMDVLGELIVRPIARRQGDRRRAERDHRGDPLLPGRSGRVRARSCSRPRSSATGRWAARSAATSPASAPCPRRRSATSGGRRIGPPTRSSRSPATSITPRRSSSPRRRSGRATASIPGFEPAPALPAGERGRGSAKRQTAQAQLVVGLPALRRDHPDSWALARAQRASSATA